MATICLSLVFSSAQGEALIALGIFFTSVLGFSLIAAATYDAALHWRFVDFPWICTSFAAIVVALLNIAEAARREHASLARSEISRSFSELIYATQSVVTNDCQNLASRQGMWQLSSEPYHGACDRMKHFLPQMTYQYDEFARSQSVSPLKGLAMDTIVPNTATSGSWAGQYGIARRFLRVADMFGPVLEAVPEPGEISWADRARRFILTTELKYWYFFLALFVGLRLSKTTAEVLQANATHK